MYKYRFEYFYSLPFHNRNFASTLRQKRNEDIKDLHSACERMLKGNLRYRFVIGTATL